MRDIDREKRFFCISETYLIIICNYKKTIPYTWNYVDENANSIDVKDVMM